MTTLPNTSTPPITLTEEQSAAVERILEWHHGRYTEDDKNFPAEYKLGGYAGTGKTTVIKEIVRRFLDLDHSPVICAFTGKACSVLRRKGIEANTIHSLIYTPIYEKGVVVDYRLKEKIEPGSDSLIIVDEASMISTQLYKDLLTFNIPILFVGDPGQLEPVGDNPNLMKHPDNVLSKIHRQADGNPIIKLANNCRTGGMLVPQAITHLTVMNCMKNPTFDLVATIKTHDQTLCARNTTRQKWNTAVRRSLGRPDLSIVAGDKIIILRNNVRLGVFNGMILFIDSIDHDGKTEWQVTAHDEVGTTYHLPIWKAPFQGTIPKGMFCPRTLAEADFAYVITVHKSQGSEWPRVLVIHESMPAKVWDMRRWCYTAITRASEHLTYLL